MIEWMWRRGSVEEEKKTTKGKNKEDKHHYTIKDRKKRGRE